MQHSDGVPPDSATGATDAILSRKSRLMAMAQAMLGSSRTRTTRRSATPQDSTHNSNHDAGQLIVNFKSSQPDQKTDPPRRDRKSRRRIKKFQNQAK